MHALRHEEASGGRTKIPQLDGVPRVRHQAGDQDAQALNAWRTHNPFRRAEPELIRRIERIERTTKLHHLGEATF